MKKIIPINVTSEGLSQTLTAVYFKKGAYNFLKADCLERGGHMEHSELAVMEVYEDRVDPDRQHSAAEGEF